MVKINLIGYGTIEIDKKLEANLNLSAREFFKEFPEETRKLSKNALQIVGKAIDKKDAQKVKKYEDEIRDYFMAIDKNISLKGFDKGEQEEEAEAEELKGEDVDEEELEAIDSPEETSLETVDEETGEVEGEIIMDEDSDSNLVPIIIKEKYEAFFKHDGSPTEKDPINSGYILIDNVSSNDRLWDINLKLENIDKTTLTKDKISLAELEPEHKHKVDYEIKELARPEIKVTEFISTINDPNQEAFSLVLNTDNKIYDRINIDNICGDKITNIEVRKAINEDFKDTQFTNNSIGEVDFVEEEGQNFVLWKIDELEAEANAVLELELTIEINDKEAKVRSGEIFASYEIEKTLSGVGIDAFDSFTNNEFNIVTSEKDDDPNNYDCKFIFKNKSDYVIRLVNADVYSPDNPNLKFVDIDPNDLPKIAANAEWISKSWEYLAEEGKYPKFKTKVEFFTVADHKLATEFKLNYSDVELAVVSVDGEVVCEDEILPSFKITPFTVSTTIKNSGGANLGQVKLVDTIQSSFLPPNREEIEIYINNNQISLPHDAITVEPDNTDPAVEHVMTINIADLENSENGVLKTDDEVLFKYPVVAHKPSKDTTFNSNITAIANTIPQGSEINIELNQFEIGVKHIRHNISRGRKTLALETEGEFEVTLTIENLGESELTNYELIEKVPKDQVIWDVSHEPEVLDEIDTKKLKWTIELIEPKSSIEVKYKTKPAGDTKVTTTEETEL